MHLELYAFGLLLRGWGDFRELIGRGTVLGLAIGLHQNPIVDKHTGVGPLTLGTSCARIHPDLGFPFPTIGGGFTLILSGACIDNSDFPGNDASRKASHKAEQQPIIRFEFNLDLSVMPDVWHGYRGSC